MEKIIAFIFGSAIGSFLNVCIYRFPKDKSIVFPSSSCPLCGALIKWYDNIPILSYFFLRAKCRACGKPISFRYPLVEFITAVSFFLLYAKFGLTVDFFKYIFFFCLLVVVSFIDIDYHAIPVHLCFAGVIVGLAFAFQDTAHCIRTYLPGWRDLPLVRSLNALIFGMGFTYLFKFFGDVLVGIYLSWRKKDSIEGETESLGLGDVDFMGVVGVFMGIKAVILVFFIAPLFALGYAVIAVIFKKSHLIPYLPYLSAAAVVVFFWQDKILKLFFFN